MCGGDESGGGRVIGGEVLGSGGGAAHGAARNSLTAAGGERAAAAKDDVAGDGGVARSLESLRTAVPSAVALYHDGDVPSAAIAAAGDVEVAAALGASHATTAIPVRTSAGRKTSIRMLDLDETSSKSYAQQLQEHLCH